MYFIMEILLVIAGIIAVATLFSMKGKK